MANLPADLPENWTQGQIISPNGTEVGLTEQHGYNYLMEQVNATQEEVNNINTNLTDVAQETTVEGIDEKIGTTTDTGATTTTGTVMGKLNAVQTDLNTINGNTSGLNDKIGTTTDTGGNATAGTVMGKLNNVIGTLNGEIETSNISGSKTASSSTTDNVNNNPTTVIGSFFAPSDGVLQITFNSNISNTSRNSGIIGVTDQYSTSIYYNTLITLDNVTECNLSGNNTYNHFINVEEGETYYIHICSSYENTTSSTFTIDNITLNFVGNGVKTSVVKSIQYGVTDGETNSIQINTVNPNKCMVILNARTLAKGAWSQTGSFNLDNTEGPYLSNLTSNRLTIVQDHDGGGTGWQVIEFY